MNLTKSIFCLNKKMAPSKEFFRELNELIAFWKNRPERIYQINLHPFRGKEYENIGITSVLFKAKGMADLWLKIYQYISSFDKQIADTIFYNHDTFVNCLYNNDIYSAVEMYTNWLTVFQDEIWATEMKFV